MGNQYTAECRAGSRDQLQPGGRTPRGPRASSRQSGAGRGGGNTAPVPSMERIEETVEGLDPAPALFTRKMSLETGQPQLQRRLSPQPPHRGQLRPGGQRKMSFPATTAPSLSSYQLISDPDTRDRLGRYRRFSNVSDAVSRKLSTTLGWRTVSIQEVVTQAKSLCGQHIRAWLKRRGLFTRKLGLQRLRSLASLPGGLAVCDVFLQLEALSLELERKYPKLYAGSCRQMGMTVVTEKMIAKNLSNMALHIFKKDISWFKVASFYNLVSSVAVDCVRQGHPEYLYGLVEAAGLVIERDVANWIANQGGWVSFYNYKTFSPGPALSVLTPALN